MRIESPISTTCFIAAAPERTCLGQSQDTGARAASQGPCTPALARGGMVP